MQMHSLSDIFRNNVVVLGLVAGTAVYTITQLFSSHVRPIEIVPLSHVVCVGETVELDIITSSKLEDGSMLEVVLKTPTGKSSLDRTPFDSRTNSYGHANYEVVVRLPEPGEHTVRITATSGIKTYSSSAKIDAIYCGPVNSQERLPFQNSRPVTG
jgi:hypothetical protein